MSARTLLLECLVAVLISTALSNPVAADDQPRIFVRTAWQAAYFMESIDELDYTEPVPITGDFTTGQRLPRQIKPDVAKLALEQPELLRKLEGIQHIGLRAFIDLEGRLVRPTFETELDEDVRNLFLGALSETRFEPTRHYREGPVFVRVSIDYVVEREGAPREDSPARYELAGDEAVQVAGLLSDSDVTQPSSIPYARILSRAEAPVLDRGLEEYAASFVVIVNEEGIVEEVLPYKELGDPQPMREVIPELEPLVGFIESFRFEPVYAEGGLPSRFRAFVDIVVNEGWVQIATRTNLVDLEAQIAAAYHLDPGRALDLLPPPYPKERMALYQVGTPSQSRAIPSGPNQMTILWEDDRPKYGGSCFGGCNTLEHVLRVLEIPPHAMRFSGELRDARVETDVLMRPDATTDELLADLELALRERFGLDVALDLRSEMIPTLVLRGSYGAVAEDPHLKRRTLNFFTDHMEEAPNVGSFAETGVMTEVLEHQLGLFVADETEGTPDEPILIRVDMSAYRTERLDLLIRNLEAQSNLQVQVEERPQEVLYVTQRSGT